MKILEEKLSKTDLSGSGMVFEGPMVKAVVDVEKGLLAVDADLHADLEGLLINNGSNQDDLWGINLWFEDDGDDFIEFDSMINVRPRQGNRSRDVEDEQTREKIVQVVNTWIK